MRASESFSGGSGGKRSRKLDAFLAAMLDPHRNIEAAAKAAGISPATAYRWWAEPGFKQRYAEANRDLLRGVTQQLLASTQQLLGAVPGSIETLTELRDSGGAETVRSWAAGKLLDLGLRAVDLTKRV